MMHDHPSAGHPGHNETLRKVQQMFVDAQSANNTRYSHIARKYPSTASEYQTMPGPSNKYQWISSWDYPHENGMMQYLPLWTMDALEQPYSHPASPKSLA